MRLISFVALLFIVVNVHAQISKHSLGFEVGPSLCFIDQPKKPILPTGVSFVSPVYGNKIGGRAAVCYSFQLPDRAFKIKSSLGVEQKGFSSSETIYSNGQPIPLSILWHTYFISAPVQFQYSFGASIKGFLTAGIFGSYLLTIGMTEKQEGNSKVYSMDKKMNTHKYINYDYGYNVGLGVDFPVTKTVHFNCEIRFSKGLFEQERFSYAYPVGQAKTNALCFLIGFSKDIGTSKIKDKMVE